MDQAVSSISSSYLEERDPRRRKRSEDSVLAATPATPESPSSGRTKPRGDNWTQRAEAFIHKIKDPASERIGYGPPTAPHSSRSSSSNNSNYPGGVVGYPSSTYTAVTAPITTRATDGRMGMNSSSSSYNHHYKGGLDPSEDGGSSGNSGGGNDHEVRKKASPAIGSTKRRDESSSSSSSSESEDEKEKLSPEQKRGILKMQKEQYEKAQKKLEAQLIKLKEQRECLKEGGAKHEDKIMKDNARLQKEVKNRLSHSREVLDKISIGLDIFNDVANNSTGHGRVESSKQSRRDLSPRHRRSRSRHKSSSPERSSEKSKKSKKKRRHRGRSISDEMDEEEEDEFESSKRKHKKKKRKYRSSSSSEDSESEGEYKKNKKKPSKPQKNDDNLPLDDSIFRMMSDLKNSKSSKRGSGGDETFMELLGKMSEAYMKAKQENNELSHRINALESENQLLKKQLEEREAKEEDERPSRSKWDVKASHIIEVEEPKRKKKEAFIPSEAVVIKEREAGEEDTSRSVRAKMIEKEERVKRNGHGEKPPPPPPNHDEEEKKERSVSKDRERRSRSRDYHRRRDYSPNERRGSRHYHRDDYRRHSYRRSRSRERRRSRSRSKERRSSSRDSRSQSKDYREKSRSKEVVVGSGRKDRNERINLDDWAEKPVVEKDPSLLSLKEKMISKEKEVEQRQQWAVVEEVKTSEPLKDTSNDAAAADVELPSSTLAPRPQVAIQWGQGIKRTTPEPVQVSKKTQPLVGKMPWVNKNGPKKPGESRFGPPPTHSNIPPPGVLSSVPTPYGIQPPPEETLPVLPPLPPPKRNPPKNPTPQAMDMNAMLAAAQAHMRARSEEFVSPEMEIPLPPLPAATDKDPKALSDTRPPKLPSPPPVREKTEMEIMIERHCPETDVNDYSNSGAPLPVKEAPKISSKFDLPPGEEDMDPSELAMLGIDPSDLAGFGK